MGQTPTYRLPWPEESDPPDGPVQIRALAEAIETGLAPIDARSKNPQQPWTRFNIPGGPTIPAGGAVINPGLTITSQGQNPWAVASASSFTCVTSGLYLANVTVRCTNQGAIAAGAYAQAAILIPASTTALDRLTPLYGATWVDLVIAGSFRATAGQVLTIGVSQTSAQIENINNGFGTLVRIAD